MAQEYIKESDLYTCWQDSQKHMKPLFEPLDEYERIARNKPHPGIARELPKVTDGTLAAFIQDTPKRIIQQVPTGEVEATDPWLDLVATYILSHEILPNANTSAALIQKCWALISKSLTYGSQPAFVQFVNRGEYFGTDFTLPYIKDVFLEPGKLSDRDSCVIMLRSWYTPSQIDQIIYKEQYLQSQAKDRGEKYESSWNLKALANLKDEKAQKAAEAQTPNERNKSDQQGYIEVVHAFQDGIGANFYSFSPRTKETIRTKENKDPRGVIPIHYMYCNIDLSNPLGRGAVEMTGGMQNLLDSEVQAYQYMRMLMMNPPIEKRGTFSKSVLKYVPGAIWDLGANPTNSAVPVKLESASLQQFPDNYGLLKSQIQNTLGGNPANDIPAQAGDPQSSKTPAGVNANQERLGISDNYLRRQFEDVFQEICETKINLWFGERSGTQEIKLDEMTANQLRDLNPAYLSSDNQIRINYDSETPKLSFKVDPTSSAVKDNQEQIESLQELIQETAQNPLIAYYLDQAGYKMNLGEAYRQLYERYNIKDLSQILQELPKDQAGQMQYPNTEKNKVSIAYNDLPPAAQAGALQDAGIQVAPEDVMQLNATQQADLQNSAPTPDNAHPLGKLMEQLRIDFKDLDPDTQRWVIQTVLQAPATGVLPSELQVGQQVHQQNIDNTKTALEIAKTAHQESQDIHQRHVGATDQALKIAQADHSMQSADAQHQFNVDQAKKQPKAGVK